MTPKSTYRLAAAAAVGTALFLLWGMGALGIVGVEGDRADLMYLGALALGLGGAIVARFRPRGMARAMGVTAVATLGVGLVALVLGKHQAEYSSVAEILGLSGMFALLFGGSAWLFSVGGEAEWVRPRNTLIRQGEPDSRREFGAALERSVQSSGPPGVHEGVSTRRGLEWQTRRRTLQS